jgi:hypothetical protein
VSRESYLTLAGTSWLMYLGVLEGGGLGDNVDDVMLSYIYILMVVTFLNFKSQEQAQPLPFRKKASEPLHNKQRRRQH